MVNYRIVILASIMLVMVINGSCNGMDNQDNLQDIYNRANKMYQDGNFQETTKLYKTLLKTWYNGYLLYNLGNCYFKMDKIAFAMACYEEAHRLLPRDGDIKFNLDTCKLMLKDEMEEPLPGMFKRLTGLPLNYLSLNEWTGLTSVFYVTFMGLLIARIMFRGRKFSKLFTRAATIAGMVFVLFFTYSLVKSYQESTIHHGFIYPEQIHLKSGPGQNFSTITQIHSGMKVSIKNEKGNWLQVSLANGWNGWIPKESVITISQALQ